MTLKPNRSDKYTTGLTCIFNGEKDKRFFLFEIDDFNWKAIAEFYEMNSLSYLVHRTWRGIHFISPTVISKKTWKILHSQLKHVNPKCPMTTLRMEPNKYAFEEKVWYKSDYHSNGAPQYDSEALCKYLNRIFGVNMVGFLSGEIQLVHYPLPVVQT